MAAVRIGPYWRLVAVGAPGYFAARHSANAAGYGEPQLHLPAPDTAGGFYAWEFQKHGRYIRMRVDGQPTFNSTLPMVEAAIAGYGIAYVPEDIVAQHLAAGDL